uniref:U1-Liphistoxin-Lm1a_1 n=1 Tax=Liphistius malayanus TaxID=1203467 RepID=A0A482ZBE3_9ARAC
MVPHSLMKMKSFFVLCFLLGLALLTSVDAVNDPSSVEESVESIQPQERRCYEPYESCTYAEDCCQKVPTRCVFSSDYGERLCVEYS